MSMMFENGGGEILTNFLDSKDKPICREERQYALFFYNALLDVKRNDDWKSFRELMDEENIKAMLGLDKNIILEKIHIKQVFYEATLMRDFFHSCDDVEKKKFNEKLLTFVLSYKDPSEKVCLDYFDKCIQDIEGIKNIEDLAGVESFGGRAGSKMIGEIIKHSLQEKSENQENDDEDSEKKIIASRLQLAKYMMRAIPDILVSYTIGDVKKEYVRAIECKYESGIGTYEDIFGKRRQLQIFVQRLIMSFLFGAEIIEKEECGLVKVDDDGWNKVYGDLCIDIDKKDNSIRNMGVTVVKFTSEDEKSSKQSKSSEGYIKIPISNLLIAQYDSLKRTSLDDR